MTKLITWWQKFKNWFNAEKSTFLSIFTFGTFMISIPYLRPGPLPGPDTPFYLWQSSKILSTGIIPADNADRTIVFLLPTLISKATNLPIEKSLALFMISNFLTLGVFTYLIARHIFNYKIALLSMLVAFLSGGLHRLAWDLYANIFSLVIFYGAILILLLQNNKSSWKIYLFFILWGFLFKSHGITAFSSLIIFPILFFLKAKQLYSFKKSLFIFFTGVPITYVIGAPLTNYILVTLYNGVFNPLIQIHTNNTEGLAPQVAPWITKPQFPPSEVPLLKSLFYLFYDSKILKLALLGFAVELISSLRKKIIWTDKNLIILAFILFFGFTQQGIIGLGWLPDRFILGLFPFLAIYSSNIIVHASNLLIKKTGKLKNITYVIISVILLITLINPTVSAVNRVRYQLTPTIKTDEYNFLRNIHQYVLEEAHVVYSTSIRHYWTIALNSNLNFIPAEHYAICGNPHFEKTIGKEKFLLGKAFGKTISPDQSVTIIKSLSKNNQVYVIFSISDECVNPENFLNQNYTLIANNANLYLVKLKQ